MKKPIFIMALTLNMPLFGWDLELIQQHQFGQTYEQALTRQVDGGDGYSFTTNKINQAYVDGLYDQLKTITEALERNNIKYSISSGTMLGAWRNGGLIMGDDDIDLFVDAADVYTKMPITFLPRMIHRYKSENYTPQWASLIADLKMSGYVTDPRGDRNYQFYHPEKTKAINALFGNGSGNFGGVDVFIMERDEKSGFYRYFDKLILHFTTFFDPSWGNMKFPISAWEKEFVTVKFGHLSVKSLAKEDATKILQEVYGDDVFTTTYKINDHVSGGAAAGVKHKTKLILDQDYYYIAASEDPNFANYAYRKPAKVEREYFIADEWVTGFAHPEKKPVWTWFGVAPMR